MGGGGGSDGRAIGIIMDRKWLSRSYGGDSSLNIVLSRSLVPLKLKEII